MEDQFEDKMAEVGDMALKLISNYFSGDADAEDKEKIDRAFKFIQHPIKVRHMDQVRKIQERSQAIRLLKFLPTEDDRQEYIKRTQPYAAPLLEHHKTKIKKKS